MTRQRRKVSYQWRLREVMAAHKLYATTELVPLLAERGITLSSSQVHRLVTTTPERLSLPVLAALCDIFDVTPNDLIEPYVATNSRRGRKTGTTGAATPSKPSKNRPTRAVIRPAGD